MGKRKKAKPGNEARGEDVAYELRYYAVSFLDLVGQQLVLRRLSQRPLAMVRDDATMAALRDSAGAVDDIRGLFERSFNVAADLELPTRVPRELRQRVRSSLETSLSWHCFSDSMAASVPLHVEGARDIRAMTSLYAMVMASCAVSLSAMYLGHPVRGGLEVGLGVAMRHGGDTYGSCLSEAYRLESEVADYPRVVVGSELRRYVTQYRLGPSANEEQAIGLMRAEEVRAMLARDTDGKWILDYAGPRFARLAREDFGQEVVDDAYRYACSQRESFLSRQELKLASRYERVAAYLEPRRKHWRVR